MEKIPKKVLLLVYHEVVNGAYKIATKRESEHQSYSSTPLLSNLCVLSNAELCGISSRKRNEHASSGIPNLLIWSLCTGAISMATKRRYTNTSVDTTISDALSKALRTLDSESLDDSLRDAGWIQLLTATGGAMVAQGKYCAGSIMDESGFSFPRCIIRDQLLPCMGTAFQLLPTPAVDSPTGLQVRDRSVYFGAVRYWQRSQYEEVKNSKYGRDCWARRLTDTEA